MKGVEEESKEYKIVESKTIFEGKILTLKIDQVKMPHGPIRERETIFHKGAVGIVPLTKDNEVYLVKQYRHPIREFLLEIPAGKLDRKEDPQECALRELEEETGCRCQSLIKQAEFFTSPGYSNEYFYLYLATGLTRQEPKPEADEELDLKVLRMPLEKAMEMIISGEIKDGKTIIGLCLAERYAKKRK